MEVIGSRIGFTLILGGIGFVLTFVGSLLLGVLCCLVRGNEYDLQ